MSEKSGPFGPNPRSIITTRVFTTTQILLSGLSRNGLTSLYCIYHGGYKIVYLEVVVLQSVEYSIAMIRLRQNGPLFPFTACSPILPLLLSRPNTKDFASHRLSPGPAVMQFHVWRQQV